MKRQQLGTLMSVGGKMMLLAIGMFIALLLAFADPYRGPIWVVVLVVTIAIGLIGLGMFIVGLVSKPDKTL